MGSKLLAWYHRLPPSLRSAAATLRGYRLRRLRYGHETDAIADQALRTDRLPAEEWQRVQNDRLREVLLHAAKNVPHYRRYWASVQAAGKDPTRLADWPILEKEVVRNDPQSLLAENFQPSQLVAEHTSGTTGKPLSLWWSREAVKQHYALFEARWRRWYGVTRHDRWAILGGQLVAPVSQTKPPFWVWNAALHQLYLSSYHLAPQYTATYLDALQRYRIRYLWGYTSSLYALAQDALRTGRNDLRMAVAVTNAEPLSEQQRDVISRAFHCPVRETYGMSELVACAGECEAGSLHLWPETGIVEVLENDEPVTPGGTGDLVCTGLLNDAMPLIRYRVGDRGALADDASPCACGRTLSRLKFIEGRKDDVVFTADGRRVGRLDTVFKSDWPVREAQIIQDRLDCVTLRFVPAEGYNDAVGREMVAELRKRIGEMQVMLESVPAIERTSNGKFRAVLCRLSPEDRTAVAAASPH